LGIAQGTIKYHNQLSEAPGAALGRNGRPSILSDEQRESLVRQIQETYHHVILWTIAEILQFFQERVVNKNSVHHWLHREPRIKD
jgi:transposase